MGVMLDGDHVPFRGNTRSTSKMPD
jgi:hypothetical protein